MNNTKIMLEAQKLYNPKTAFGNVYLIKLLKQIKVPNNSGEFKVVGDSIVEIIGVKWECMSCGHYNTDEIQKGFSGSCIDVKTQCKKCKAKHLIKVNN